MGAQQHHPLLPATAVEADLGLSGLNASERMRSKHAGQDTAAIGLRRFRRRSLVCMPDRQPSFNDRRRWTEAARFNGAGSPTRIRGGLVTVPQDYLDRPVAVVGAGTFWPSRRADVHEPRRASPHPRPACGPRRGGCGLRRAADRRAFRYSPPLGAGRAEYVERLEDAVAGAWLVIESVPERLELKQDVFALLESVAEPDAILASNSSSYASRLIVDGLSTTHRMLDTHFYMPPMQIAVDVMSCGNTSQEVLDFVMVTFPEYGLRPFLCGAKAPDSSSTASGPRSNVKR